MNTTNFASYYLETLVNHGEDIKLSHASGCIYKFNNKYFLISNWHVFSGKHLITKKPLHKTCAIPNKLILRYSTLQVKNINKIIWKELIINLKDVDGNNLWLEHYYQNQLIDIAAIEINHPETVNLFAINELRYQKTDLLLEITSDIFIIGYPLILSETYGFPIWKRGSIASEPGFESPYFFIDSATRSGMSGSPVIYKSSGQYKDIHYNTYVDANPIEAFIGIYSSREPSDKETDAQIGHVWKAFLIEELLRANKF